MIATRMLLLAELGSPSHILGDVLPAVSVSPIAAIAAVVDDDDKDDGSGKKALADGDCEDGDCDKELA